jgi:hypothetical protein
MLHDLTDVLLNPRIKWDRSVTELAQHFEPAVSAIDRGLYIQYFENRHHLHVYDKNRNFATGGSGALVINANGASLKPGKFQHGFLRRRRQDADHLHRERGEAIGDTYRHCLKFALALDLTAHRDRLGASMRHAETLLKRRIDSWVEEQDLLHQEASRRGDWRRLQKRVPLVGLREAMHDALVATAGELGLRIRRL